MPASIVRVGLDLAKSVLQVHATDHGRVLIRRKLRREDVEAFFPAFAALPRQPWKPVRVRTIGDVCSSAWGMRCASCRPST